MGNPKGISLVRPDAGEVLWTYEGDTSMAHLSSIDWFVGEFRTEIGKGVRISRRKAYLGLVHEGGAYLRVVPTAEDERDARIQGTSP